MKSRNKSVKSPRESLGGEVFGLIKNRRKINWLRLAIVVLGFGIIIAFLVSIVSSFTSDSTSDTAANSRIEKTSSEFNSTQRDAIRTLMDFHENITRKNYRRAYDCLSPEFRSSMNYDGWAKGFKTTVSSSVSNIQISSESSRKIVLNYDLEAVDDPGGTSRFRGRVTLIKTAEGWKIDEIVNKSAS